MKIFAQLALSAVLGMAASVSARALLPADYSLVEGCRIFDRAAKPLKVFPGERCLFLPDGSYLSATATTLSRLSADGSTQWTFAGNFHHQMALSDDGQSVLLLTSEVFENVRFDQLQIVSLTGKLERQVSLRELLAQKKLAPLRYENKLGPADVAFEGSHANSFYSIPSNVKLPTAMKGAAYLVNAFGHGFFALDRELKTVVWNATAPGAIGHFTHDAQMLPSGELLHFVNYSRESTEQVRQSRIEVLALPHLKVVRSIAGKPAALFLSRFGGSVQSVNDDLTLFTTSFTGTYLYSQRARDIIWSTDEIHAPAHAAPRYIQKVSAEVLTSFLQHHRP